MFLSSLYRHAICKRDGDGEQMSKSKRIGIRILTSPASLGSSDTSCLSIHSEDSAQAIKLLPIVCASNISRSLTLSAVEYVAVYLFSGRYLDTKVVLIPTHEFCAPNPILFKTAHSDSATERALLHHAIVLLALRLGELMLPFIDAAANSQLTVVLLLLLLTLLHYRYEP